MKPYQNNKQEPSLIVETVVQVADKGMEDQVTKKNKDYIPVPFPGCKEKRGDRLHAFCSRLDLLPPDAWGAAAKKYSLKDIIEAGTGKMCFVEVENDTFKNKEGKEIPTTKVAYAGYYDVTDDRMSDRHWMITDPTNPPDPPSSQSPLDRSDLVDDI